MTPGSADSADLALGPDAVDVWLVRPQDCASGELAGVLGWLTDAERKRYHAFLFDRHRVEYLATRALVRTALSAYAALPPADWQFHANAYGRPALEPRWDLQFNLSNHPTLIVCAVRRGGELGVDVEPLTRGGEIVEIARSVFAPGELTALHALPEPARADRALSLWTLKEAYIKARGMGLSIALDSFAFTLDPAGPTIGFAASPDDPVHWQFRTADVLGHRVALATERTAIAPTVRAYHVTRLGAGGFQRDRLADWPEGQGHRRAK